MIRTKVKKVIVSAPIVAVAMGLIFVSTGSVIANGVVHSVHVGGADICSALGFSPGCDANFSLTANEFGDGSVNGRWVDVFAVIPGEDPETLIIAIDCLHVNGSEAWVAGEIVGPDFPGFRVGTRVQDNGQGKNAVLPDMISFTNIFFGDCTTEPNFPLFALEEGQVKVR